MSNINNFFKLRSTLSSKTFQAQTDNTFDGHNILIYGIYDSIRFPVVFRECYGKKLEDLLDTGWPSLYLISEKAIGILEKNKLTGWKPFNIKLFDKNGNEVNGYHGLSITGRCGEVDFNKSTIIEKRLVPHGPLGSYYKGYYVGLDEWDNSDFFIPRHTIAIIATKRAAEVIKGNKLTNIILTDLANIETDELIVKNKK
jgi:hypothetical protein